MKQYTVTCLVENLMGHIKIKHCIQCRQSKKKKILLPANRKKIAVFFHKSVCNRFGSTLKLNLSCQAASWKLNEKITSFLVVELAHWIGCPSGKLCLLFPPNNYNKQYWSLIVCQYVENRLSDWSRGPCLTSVSLLWSAGLPQALSQHSIAYQQGVHCKQYIHLLVWVYSYM